MQRITQVAATTVAAGALFFPTTGIAMGSDSSVSGRDLWRGEKPPVTVKVKQTKKTTKVKLRNKVRPAKPRVQIRYVVKPVDGKRAKAKKTTRVKGKKRIVKLPAHTVKVSVKLPGTRRAVPLWKTNTPKVDRAGNGSATNGSGSGSTPGTPGDGDGGITLGGRVPAPKLSEYICGDPGILHHETLMLGWWEKYCDWPFFNFSGSSDVTRCAAHPSGGRIVEVTFRFDMPSSMFESRGRSSVQVHGIQPGSTVANGSGIAWQQRTQSRQPGQNMVTLPFLVPADRMSDFRMDDLSVGVYLDPGPQHDDTLRNSVGTPYLEPVFTWLSSPVPHRPAGWEEMYTKVPQGSRVPAYATAFSRHPELLGSPIFNNGSNPALKWFDNQHSEADIWWDTYYTDFDVRSPVSVWDCP